MNTFEIFRPVSTIKHIKTFITISSLFLCRYFAGYIPFLLITYITILPEQKTLSATQKKNSPAVVSAVNYPYNIHVCTYMI